MRRTAAIVALIAAGVLLSACGKDAHFGGGGSSRTQTAAAADRPLTRTQARQLAVRLNLQADDLPGFKRSSSHERHTSASTRAERELRHCMGGHAFRGGLAEVGSGSFERQIRLFHVSVSSSVTIVGSLSQAKSELEAIRGHHTQVCLTRFLDELLAGDANDGGGAKVVSISSATPHAPGTSGTYAWRIVGKFTLKGVPIPFYLELVGFLYHQDQVQLFSFGLPLPFPAVAEQELFSLLVSRAKADGAARVGKGGGLPKTPSHSGPRTVQVAL